MWKELLCILPTFFIFAFGLVMFRAGSALQAWHYIVRMLTFAPAEEPGYKYTGMLLWYLGIFIIIEWLGRNRRFGFDFPDTGIFRYRAVRWGICWLMAMATFLMAGSASSFVYFQF